MLGSDNRGLILDWLLRFLTGNDWLAVVQASSNHYMNLWIIARDTLANARDITTFGLVYA